MNSAELICAYSKNQHNKYIMEQPSIRYREVNRTCADVVEVFLRIDNNIIQEFSFDGYLSITATACTSIVGELIEKKTLDEVLLLHEGFIHENIGKDISPRRKYAALIGLLAIKNAIHTYKNDASQEDFSDIELL